MSQQVSQSVNQSVTQHQPRPAIGIHRAEKSLDPRTRNCGDDLSGRLTIGLPWAAWSSARGSMFPYAAGCLLTFGDVFVDMR